MPAGVYTMLINPLKKFLLSVLIVLVFSIPSINRDILRYSVKIQIKKDDRDIQVQENIQQCFLPFRKLMLLTTRSD